MKQGPILFPWPNALRCSTMTADHPEWETIQPFQAVLENDMEALVAAGVIYPQTKDSGE